MDIYLNLVKYNRFFDEFLPSGLRSVSLCIPAVCHNGSNVLDSTEPNVRIISVPRYFISRMSKSAILKKNVSNSAYFSDHLRTGREDHHVQRKLHFRV